MFDYCPGLGSLQRPKLCIVFNFLMFVSLNKLNIAELCHAKFLSAEQDKSRRQKVMKSLFFQALM